MEKDRQPTAARVLLTRVKTALKAVLGKRLAIQIAADEQKQPTLTVGRQAVFTVEVKETVLKTVTPLLALWPHPAAHPWVLVTTYVSDEMGRQLRQHGLCYADAAGNAWLQHPEADLYILVQGQPRPRKAATATTAGRAFRKSGLRVLFHLLTQPDLVRQPYRTIATRTDTPVATVGQVMLDLIQQGFLLDEEPRQLLRRPELTQRWVAGYGDTLRPHLPTQRYRWLAADQAAGGWQNQPLGAATHWGGEPAAALLLDGFLRPEFFTLYSTATRPALMRQLRLVPDPTGSVEVLEPFDQRLNFHHPTSPCVPPLLVYADLLLSGDARNREVAQKLYARYLQHPA
ncbi:hypothetical protein GCM10022408_11490 [Hymenobacter fastidiosus]|uniref:Uncharacterized protein n=1 Tax=Hymenobacter fastidiosus TaxID=486264 RepID=A0ABP7RTY9_9BACT